MFFYFLTIDKTITTSMVKPTKELYCNVFLKLKKKCKINYTNEKYPVKCYEFKSKGSVRKNNKCHDWLHFHGIVQSKNKINYKDSIIKGFSIVWVPIYDMANMARLCGYCNKDKIDKSEIIKKKIKEGRKVIVKSILDYYE